MVPCIDMANHASADGTKALYEADNEGNAVLLVREGVSVMKGEEVSITYGDTKGACEMLFSYGFIDAVMLAESDAREIFLDLEMMDDDPLAMAKKHVSTAAPGVKITRHAGNGNGKGEGEGVQGAKAKMDWTSEYIYLLIINEEDGLEFEVLQTIDDSRELRVSWKGSPLTEITLLPSLLEKEELYPVYRLRAVTVLQQRVDEQLRSLEAFGGELEGIGGGTGTGVREVVREMAVRLHGLEMEFCLNAREALEGEFEKLAGMEVVRRYIDGVKPVDEMPEDASAACW